MTLNTSVVIGKPYDVRELYAFCRQLLDTPDSVQPIETPADSARSYQAGQASIGHPMGVGLVALLDIHYGVDGPFPTHVHDEWCSTKLGGKYNTTQEDIDSHAADIASCPTENGWAAIEITFDTTYGYQGDNGESCSDLHARLVTALGLWLDARDLPWKWQNEYTGEWFDRFDQLAEFGNAHRATGADDWFRNVVQAAIAACHRVN